ncbi:hypothetical protein FYJ75_10060 [Roseburia sp. MUC/MUC-530-WT-4D]|uniref:DUF1444 family protein n=1 Tax=Roseburia porci TaxID=2605790 RepID=A0A6L5YSE0_9FIRM|nr:DUF5688 family protein [Roseburia porci]MDD6743775.1 DUF5688 family protein [Roseburia porci]MST75360.1 hypothetical protein [Roseburia porci]
MNYQDFLSTIITKLKEHFDDTVSLELQTVTKNNGTLLDALIIMNPDINISPTIFLNPYYHRYLSGITMEDICDDILKTYEAHRPSESIDITFFTDFEQVKERIIFKLVSYEKNKELLEKVPYFRFLDFAIIFNCLLNADSEDYATILIYNSHLNYWGVTANTLFSYAKHNTPLLLPYQLNNMADLLKDMLPDDADSEALQPMYILSNSGKVNGATCILYDGLLSQIAERLKSDFILLPSSIHEVILVPVDQCEELCAFSSMVTEVNETQLTDEEILSDHAYYYERSKGVLAM